MPVKKIGRIILTLVFIIFAIAVIFYIYWPFASGFINEKRTVGDALMHLANIISFKRNHPFPIMAWKTEWGGYPVIEGYPWLHYYLIQPILHFFSNPGVAMDYYSAFFLFVYYILSFLLLFYISRNVFLALLFGLVLIYGADSQMPFSVNAFMTFTASQFFLPLILLLTIIARERKSEKILLLSSLVLSISFYSHGAMTGIIIFPVIFPFLILNEKMKISKKSIIRTAKYFIVFALLSSVQIYQFISYNSQGYLRGVKPFPLHVIPSRLLNLASWLNPVLLPLFLLFMPFFILAVKKRYLYIKPYLFSFFFLLFIFTLMVFNITSMNLVLLAERVLWAISLIFLLLFAKVIKELIKKNVRWSMAIRIISLIMMGGYLYLTLIIKPPHLVPDILSATDPYEYKPKEIDSNISHEDKYSSKYDLIYSYPPLTWSQSFDNYRTDGISWAIYSNWGIWSSNPRYKGRFPAAKGLALDWSGLVSAAEYGLLGEAGTPDNSKWAIDRTLFFLDWYGIRHIELGENDPYTAGYLREKPLITSTEKSKNITYNDIDKKYITPVYSPTNAKIMAVVAPEKQYDNFIRTLSYSKFTSKNLIPVYLGSNLKSLHKKGLKYFDAIFLYGYKKPIFPSGKWKILSEYVKDGGNLIIETGQKVSEAQSFNLPEVFPIQRTKLTVVNKPWNVEVKENELTNNINILDFKPLKTKYLPYSISEAPKDKTRDWAKPVLMKDGSAVLVFGQLGKGRVVWSGLNLPFHAIDNRNISETIVFANILNWFFPKIDDPITDFEVKYPNPEKIVVKSDHGKGFLFKENYDPGWSAKLNGKKTKIFKAGLLEMYVPFNPDNSEHLVELNYHGTPIYWCLFLVSSLSLVGIFIYLIFNKNLLSWSKKLIKFDKILVEEDY